MKTFVPNQHQNKPKMCLSYQIKYSSARAQELASEYKSAHGLMIVFRKDACNFNLRWSPDEYANCIVKTYDLTPEIAIDFG